MEMIVNIETTIRIKVFENRLLPTIFVVFLLVKIS